jgi:tRNA A37 threonylcarbamoyladenosine dehydratase
LLGKSGIENLRASRVAIFGIGGVGGYVAEALARAGVGVLDLIDHDTVSVSNLNRQIIALHSTIGRKKVEVMAERISDICPETVVNIRDTFYLPENAASFDFSLYDYVVDAIDTVAGKISLVVRAKEANVPIICAMGAGNKLDPSAFRIADLSETSVCPLAKVMRTELRKRGILHTKVVYSREIPIVPLEQGVPGSVSFVPSAVGLLIASEVVKDLCGVDFFSRRKGASK